MVADDKELATNVNDVVGVPGFAVTNDHTRKINEDMGNTRIEEYVGSLIKDPNFTISIAEAVARSITTQQRKQQELDLNLSLTEM